ncbi:hypoxic response protein Hrp1 [Sphaerisporangium rubeum]|uniref:CBS domain-containing protein n=1 Tax=Sphaerisporangium rubeum TaxID=321317 RepID=A0A7X0IFX9_9ACTN|nr:CBS domain-containing protein [Sphaerisporangium rubeum]MBB6473844.1 CBS domain-containing protein [Sphaerisporangium rubeum]
MTTHETGKTAKDVMHQGAQCIGEHDSLRTAAQMMRDLGVGALPICGEDDRLKGIITDRDIVVKCCAEDGDLDRTTAGQLAEGGLVWVEAGTRVEEALDVMARHQIKRIPVIDHHRLVGMISEADLARELPDEELAEFVHRVYAGT